MQIDSWVSSGSRRGLPEYFVNVEVQYIVIEENRKSNSLVEGKCRVMSTFGETFESTEFQYPSVWPGPEKNRTLSITSIQNAACSSQLMMLPGRIRFWEAITTRGSWRSCSPTGPKTHSFDFNASAWWPDHAKRVKPGDMSCLNY